MACVLCASDSEVELSAEIMIHFSGLRNIDRPGVLLYPTILVCLNCGSSRFTVPEHELPHLTEGAA